MLQINEYLQNCRLKFILRNNGNIKLILTYALDIEILELAPWVIAESRKNSHQILV